MLADNVRLGGAEFHAFYQVLMRREATSVPTYWLSDAARLAYRIPTIRSFEERERDECVDRGTGGWMVEGWFHLRRMCT